MIFFLARISGRAFIEAKRIRILCAIGISLICSLMHFPRAPIALTSDSILLLNSSKEALTHERLAKAARLSNLTDIDSEPNPRYCF